MGIAIGLILAGLCIFVGLRFLVNWLMSQPDQPIRVKPQPNHTRRGKMG